MLALGFGLVGLLPVFSAHASARAMDVQTARDEDAGMQSALHPAKHARPVIAVLGLNEGSETTDYLVPYGVLKHSGVADVFALSIHSGPITLMPALRILADATVAEFDQRFPDGADFVIVPAMHKMNDPAILAWLRQQSERGANIVGVCAGALVVANAGLLKGKLATTHWFRVDELRKIDATIRTVANRRYVVDRGVITTTGVSASLPVSLAIVAAVAGRTRADALAQELGAGHWNAQHDSSEFRLRAPDMLAFANNYLAFWRHETIGLPVAPGDDEIALALAANAYAATHIANVKTLAATTQPIVLRSGLRLLPDAVHGARAVDVTLPPMPQQEPARALDRVLADIGRRYGRRSVRVVQLELEYPQQSAHYQPLATAPPAK